MANFLKIFCITILFLPIHISAQCGWQASSSGITTDLKAVHFPTPQYGWAVGVGGKVLHSATGGLTWVPQNANTAVALNSVHFVNENIGWVVGNKGVIRTTTDGGLNWTTQTATGITNDLYDVWCLNENTGWIVGACGLILQTVNGGAQWSQVSSAQTAHLLQVKVPNGSDGVVTTSIAALLNTNNSGAAWPSKAVIPRSFRAFDMEIGGRAFAAATTLNGGVLRSDNAGSSWTSVATPSGGGSWQSLSMTSSSTVYMAGLDGKLFKSTDAGSTWTAFNTGLGTTDIYGLYMHSDTLGWAVGEAGKIFLLKIPAPPVITGPSTVCGAAISLKANGGYTSWRWSGGQTTQTINVVAAGTYMVTATASNNCTGTASITVAAGQVPTLTVNTTSATCGQANGTVDLILANVIGTPTYSWNNNTTTQSLQNITAGLYTVTVTSGNGCTATSSVTVNGSTRPVVTTNITAASCEKANGLVRLDTSGTTGIPTYLWSNSATTKDLLSVAAGAYTVIVTSGNGCTATASAVVGGTIAPTVMTSAVVAATCERANGSISLEVANTTGMTTYLWGNSATTQHLSMVLAGTYTVTVTSGNGCTATTSAVVGGSMVPTAMALPMPASCDRPNGGIQLDTSRTVGPVTYLWSNNATTKDLLGIVAGAYMVTVSSGNGCSTTTSTNVNGSPAPVIMVAPIAAICDQANGSVDLMVSNTTGATSYFWSNAATTQDLPAVVAGIYTVTVTSGNGCTATDSAIVGGGGVLTTTISTTPDLCGQSKGAVVLTNLANVIGTPLYHWNNTATTQNLQNVAAGIYVVTITNGNGCTTIQSATVTNTNTPPQISAVANPSAVCPGKPVALIATGGITVDDYKWSNGVLQNQTFVPTQTQTYTVTVTGANACTATTTVVVTVHPNPIVQITGPDVLCMGSATLDAGIGLSYTWSSGQSTQKITVTASGTYSVILTDNNGCIGTGTRTIGPNVDGLTPQISGPLALCDGVALLDAGSGYDTYAWSSGQSTQTISVDTAKTYSVTVTSSNGCTGTDTQIVGGTVSSPMPTISGPTSFCKGAVTLSAIGPYKEWQWSTGQNGTVNSITVTAANTYSVTVKDMNECTGTASAVLTVADNTPPLIQLGIPVNITVTCNNVPAPSPLSASDNCDDNVTSTGVPTDVVSGMPCGTRTIQRTWRVQDAAGNAATQVQTITVLDNVPPLITSNLPANTTVTCGNLPLASVLPATDACDSGLTATALPVDNMGSLNPCGTGQFMRSWTATDCSGNTAVRTQLITVVDAIAPTITGVVPPAIAVSCGDPLPAKAPLSASDNCDAQVTATNIPVDDLTGLTSCGTGVVLRIWTVADCNGNTTTATQRITVIDNKAPVLVIPANVTVDCDAVPNANTPNVTATDNCTLAPTITYEGETMVNPGACSPQLIRTWKAVDCSGNTTTAIQVLTIKDDKAPVFDNIPNNISICQGTVLPSVSLVWNDHCTDTGTAPSMDVTTGTMITRTWRHVDACGNVGTAIQQIQIVPPPQVDAGPSNTICAGQSVVLTASGGTGVTNYAWSNNVQQGQPFFPTATQTYTVTVTGTASCTATATTTVTVNPIPVANALNNITVCAGKEIAPIVFVGTSGADFNWTNSNTNIGLSGAGSGNIAAFTPPNTLVTQTSTIIVTPKIGTCPGLPRPFTITVNPSPTMNAVNDISVCGKEPIALIAFSGTLGADYKWTNNNTNIGLPPNGSGNIGGFIPPLQKDSQISTITVTPNVGGCPGAPKTFRIYVKANPLPIISGSDILCNADTATLRASGPYANWKWSGGQTTDSVTIANSGVYSVTVTDNNQCTGVASKTISQLTGPAVAILGDKQFCPNGSTTLSAGLQYPSYQWSTGATTATITVNTAGTYSVTVTNANTCTGVDSVVTSLHTPPVAQLGLNEASGLISNDSIVCKGDNVNFTGHGGSLYKFFINGVSLGIPDTLSYFWTSTLKDDDIISLWTRDYNGCQDSTEFGEPLNQAPIRIQVNELPNWTGAQLFPLKSCKGEPVLLRMNCPNMPNGAYTFEYELSGANILPNGEISVNVQNRTGVLDLGSLINPGLTNFSIKSIENAAGCKRLLDGGNSAIGFINGSGIQTLLEATICKNSSYLFCGENCTQEKIYTCQFTSAFGCDSTVELRLKVVDKIDKKLSVTTCKERPYDFYGQILTNEGTYMHTIPGLNGNCDTLISLTLSHIKEPLTKIQKGNLCPGQTFVFGGESYSTSGTYIDTLKTITGCDSLITVLILMDIKPLATAGLGSDIQLCDVAPVTFNALPGGCNGCTYLWSSGATQSAITVTPASTTSYGVTVTDSQGCISTDSIRVNVGDGTPVEVKKTICDGAPCFFCGQFYQQKGIYPCPSKNGRACDSILTLEVITEASFSAKSDTILLKTGETSKDINVLDNDTFIGVVGLDIDKSPQKGSAEVLANNLIQYKPNDSREIDFDSFQYILCSNPSLNCKVCVTGTVIIEIKKVSVGSEIPNLFFPDGPNADNKIFDPRAVLLSKKEIQDEDVFEMIIVNRFGEVVFQSDKAIDTWDGTCDGNKGKPLPVGTYYYLLRVNGKTCKKGPITLLRP